MKVYPNPTRDILTIDFSGAINNVEVLDMLGRKCKVTMNDEKNINVQSLQAGSYMLKIATENGTSTTKFVKE
jgi:hypothetical protein